VGLTYQAWDTDVITMHVLTDIFKGIRGGARGGVLLHMGGFKYGEGETAQPSINWRVGKIPWERTCINKG